MEAESFGEMLVVDEGGIESCCPENGGSFASRQGPSSCHAPSAGPAAGRASPAWTCSALDLGSAAQHLEWSLPHTREGR